MRLFGSYKESKFVRGAVRAPRAEDAEAKHPVAVSAVEQAPAPVRKSENETVRPQRGAAAPPELAQRSLSGKRRKSKRKKRRERLTALAIVGALLMIGYLVFCWIPWSDGTLPKRAQGFFITQSRESHSFQWVQYFFAPYIREPYEDREWDARVSQENFNSQDEHDPNLIATEPAATTPTETTTPPETEAALSEDQIAFYELFYELDFESMEAYIAAHPDVIANGYDHIYINEAGLDDEGTDIVTTKGEQVLAIDAYNQVLLVRIVGDTYRGVLATAKDPSRLILGVSRGISSVHGVTGYGQTAGTIAKNYNGILAISGSGFNDPEGNGTGGEVAGMCRSNGKDYGWAHRYYGCKRLELREDGWLYVVDAQTSTRSDVTNAMEFEPGMIVDGQRLPNYVYTSENPRACVGQTDKGEILMLGIEGRRADCPGCSVSVCTDILLAHRCVTAMNMDGGTSAMLWFDGEPVIRCSNTNTPEGRYLPNAWVYVRAD